MDKMKEITYIEIWKQVKGFEGCYDVSNFGRIKSLARITCSGQNIKERVLKPYENASDGYFRVPLNKDGKLETKILHKLVAIAFLNHKPCGHTIVVDHIDNNKSNNHIDNLQLITQRENSSKDKRDRSSKYVGVAWYKDIINSAHK